MGRSKVNLKKINSRSKHARVPQMEMRTQFGCREQEQHNTFGSSLVPKLSCVKRVWCPE